MFGMKTRKATDRKHDTTYFEYVTLADGTTVAVARGNLAAAKSLLAAQKAAERRVAAARQPREVAPAPVLAFPTASTGAPVPASPQRHLQSARRQQSLYRIASAGTPARDGHIGAADGSGGELRRIALPVALPCALGDCGQPTSVALIEPDPSGAGLWNLLPICQDGASHASAGAAAFGRAE